MGKPTKHLLPLYIKQHALYSFNNDIKFIIKYINKTHIISNNIKDNKVVIVINTDKYDHLLEGLVYKNEPSSIYY